MIIAVGYRVNSKKATNFRVWATKVLKEYMIKGVVMDNERLGRKLNAFLQFNGQEILNNSGKISQKVAQELAYKEYEKFKIKQDKLYKSDFNNFINETKIIEGVK